jgi:hypothetical protein
MKYAQFTLEIQEFPMQAKRILFVFCILMLLSASFTFSASSAPADRQVEQAAEAQSIPVNQIIVKYKASEHLAEAVQASAIGYGCVSHELSAGA